MVVLSQTHRLRLLLFALFAALQGCGTRQPAVVVYASQDQLYAEPILKAFERETGIRVRAIYDSEAVKTVGLVNRLIAEKSNPQCDVFWNNEELRTRQLASRDIVKQWAAFGYRSRRTVINTNLVFQPPKSLIELTNEQWRGKLALAYPLFGTTATHFLALRQHWGAEPWERWCQALQSNRPFLVDGNSAVVQLVGRGEAAIGLTDSDDIAAARRQGMPVRALEMDEYTLLIPNSIAIMRNAPHPREAEELFTYLQSSAVRTTLLSANALEGMNITNKAITVDWPRLLSEVEPATATLRQVFLR